MAELKGAMWRVEFVRELVGNLVKLDPSMPIGLEIVCGLARFTGATTGALFGEIFVGTDHDRAG